MDIAANKERLEKDFLELHRLGKDSDGGITRLAFTGQDNDSHDYVKREMERLGFKTRYDNVGNLYVTLESGNPKSKKILIGSHLDSVKNGGNYDGVVGVLSGIEVLRLIKENNIKIGNDIEVVSFRGEESNRFRTAMIGSYVVTGKTDSNDLKKIKDEEGITAYQAIKDSGFQPDNTSECVWDVSKIRLYLEHHIEQGRVLEDKKKRIGVVSGIAAPVRYIIRIYGREDHSGATPMDMRIDAVDALGELICAKERIMKEALAKGYKTVCTIGNCIIPRGSMNKVAGEAHFYLDLRDINHEHSDEVEKSLVSAFDEICERRNIRIEYEEVERKKPVELPREILSSTEDVCKRLGIPYEIMPSGAGHDGMNLIPVGIPVGMIFIPNKDGISHAKEEFSSMEDIALGTKVLLETVISLSAHPTV